jgi:CBS domain containing-hemolysin-like protein
MVATTFGLAAVLALVAANGFFVAAEFALVKVRGTQLDPLIAKGHRRARVARHLMNNIDAFLSAAQLGITLTSLGLGWAGEPIFEALLKPLFSWWKVDSVPIQKSIAFGVGFTVITFLHIVVGEQAPKSFAIKKSLPTALWVAYPLRWFHAAAYPFIWVLNQSSLWLLRRIGMEPVSESELLHSDEELRLLFATSQKRSGGTTLGRDIAELAKAYSIVSVTPCDMFPQTAHCEAVAELSFSPNQ